jgi:hypothetical protein
MAANHLNSTQSFDFDVSMEANDDDGPSIAINPLIVYSSESSADGSYDEAEMSDGGVPIDLSTLDAGQPNAEMDMVDADMIGLHNLPSITSASAFHADNEVHDFDHDTVSQMSQEDHMADSEYDVPDDSEDDDLLQDEPQALDPMSAVALQLQNLQDMQEQGEFMGEFITYTEVHGTNQGNSIDPFFYIHALHLSAQQEQGAFSFPPLQNSLPSTTSNHSGALVATIGSHLGVGMAGHTTSFAPVSSDMGWGVHWSSDGDSDDEDSVHADNLQVEEQRNDNLREFLYTWAREDALKSTSKKRKRGPNLLHIDKLAEDRPLEVRRSDLRGNHCDFQGIDWTKLEVSRNDARERRDNKYKNYTNLRPPLEHVSYHSKPQC